MAEEKQSFEQVMEELENIVKKLENADIPLDDALEHYKKGIELSKWCDNKLSDVEKQVATIIDENGTKTPINSEE
ncbi:Exodeoxyribonuclease VII small subunit [Amphibacillus marinus]|uniref:Exodeoxyribonuclease 7 small subunit n=1 Tax=Amphibacillus marinus TaxID=872970 RepID=A0A1H8NLC4_9BACI|nr:exodeoxyribonuclease VII small subunit [Amphibacillus marinus]SEO30208.1 Exodeoxyribonuclease VII small subunit [Amphibacillus marinus]